MTILRRLFSAGPESVPLTNAGLTSLFMGAGTASGRAVSETGSLAMPAVWRAVNLLAGTVASLPLHPYRSDSGARLRVTTGRAAEFLRNPHPDLTPYELWETVISQALLWGNAYLWLGRDELGRLREVRPLSPSRVLPGRKDPMSPKVYVVNGDYDNPYSDSSILHIPGLGYDTVCGVSPIALARQGIGLALSAEEYGARLFGSGSLATGILSTEQRLTPEQADILTERWKAKRTGLASAHETLILDSGATFQQLSIPPEDAQFIESRSFQVTEIARMFGIPPHMLMDTDKSTSWGTGIEQQSIGFVVYTLRPWLTRIEQRVSRILRPEPVYARYSVEGLLRGDSAQRSEFYTKMWGIGALSTNDIRALEELAPVEGGDVRYRPLNMGVLGTSDPQGV